jgi:hypothetical protein
VGGVLVSTRSTLSLLGGFALSASCLVVQPLEDYPTQASRGGSGAMEQPAGGEGGGGGSSGSNVGNAGSGGCETNADCKAAGTADEPYLCRAMDHQCVRLRQEVCPVALADDISNPNSIVIGAFATLDQSNPERSAIVYAHQLAWEELSGDDIGGLPGPGAKRRPLSLVICYNQEDKVDAGLAHLVDNLGVKGVLATLKPGDLRRAYEKYADKDVFYLSPVTVTESVATLEDDGKVWNLLGQTRDLIPTYTALLPRVEAFARSRQLPEGQGGEGGGGGVGGASAPDAPPLRVALVTTLDAFDSELARKLESVLAFNGKSKDDNELDGNYKAFTAAGTAPEDITSIVDQLRGFRPAVVLSAASEVMTVANGVIKLTETTWELGGDEPPPVWVLSPFNAGDLTYLSPLIGSLAVDTEEDLMQDRFIGVSIAGPTDNEAQFDYHSSLGKRFGDIYKDTSNYYDATYFMAYAMLAAGTDLPLGGARIAAGMQRLLQGSPTPIGPDNILDVFDVLQEPGATLELRSMLGPPSFDPTTGVRQVDGSVFCFNRTGKQATPVFDSVRYDRAQKKLVGTENFCSTAILP